MRHPNIDTSPCSDLGAARRFRTGGDVSGKWAWVLVAAAGCERDWACGCTSDAGPLEVSFCTEKTEEDAVALAEETCDSALVSECTCACEPGARLKDCDD
jgi:hypothetical protein